MKVVINTFNKDFAVLIRIKDTLYLQGDAFDVFNIPVTVILGIAGRSIWADGCSSVAELPLEADRSCA